MRLPRLLRPWSTVDNEELRLLRLLEEKVRLQAYRKDTSLKPEIEEILDMLVDSRRS